MQADLQLFAPVIAPMDILIKNALVVTMDRDKPLLRPGQVGIKQGKIAYVGAETPTEQAARTIDGTGKLLMPGLHNIHTHLAMSAMRGYADDLPLQQWLTEKVFPVEARHDDRTVYASALLGIAESIRFGTVSVKDMYFTVDGVAKAAFDSGIKANLANGAIGQEQADYNFYQTKEHRQMEDLRCTWQGADGGRIRLELGIHAQYTSFPKLWNQCADYAARHNLAIHLHCSESRLEHEQCKARFGKTPAQLFAQAGVFQNKTTAAHCVWCEPEDWQLFRKYGVTVAHNPVSNLKLGSGIAPLAPMLEAGICVGLGTDSVCSNNSHDLFEELKLAALLQKGTAENPALINACKAIELATVNGAYAQGREGESGKIAVGFDADLVLLDLQSPGLLPVHSPYSTVAYSAKGSDVVLTMVRGKILYEQGQYTTIDMEKLNYEINSYVMPKLFG